LGARWSGTLAHVTQDQAYAIQSPQDTKAGAMVNLSSATKRKRLWRKQILPLGSINYDGREIRFDSAYHRDLVRSFREGAYGQVPFQLADKDNAHTNDPERTRGDLVDLRAEKDGLYGYFELPNPTLVLNNKKLGVSCRILENYTREHDGKKFGRALQHVLGTLDPRITGMKPWESVELSNQVDSELAAYTVDLSASFYTESGQKKDGAEMPDANEDKQVVELSTAQLERLNALLEQDAADEQVIAGLNPDDFEPDAEETDEDERDAEELETEDDEVDSVALAQIAELQRQVVALSNHNTEQAVDFEVRQLAATGLAPSIVEAARPLLSLGAGVVELSNGNQVSPAGQTRTLLRTILELSNKGLALVDLDREVGALTGADGAAADRKAMLDELDSMFGR
jgi:hypothetical protein